MKVLAQERKRILLDNIPLKRSSEVIFELVCKRILLDNIPLKHNTFIMILIKRKRILLDNIPLKHHFHNSTNQQVRESY